jgi:hypothetical protein
MRSGISLHPAVELAIDLEARGAVDPLCSVKAPDLASVRQAARVVARRTRAIRGQPKDAALHWTVQALLIWWQRATGKRVTASRMRDNLYDANLASRGAQAIYALLKTQEPALTEMTLVNIIRSPKTRAAISGKTFLDFCPTYGWRIDAQTGLPIPRANQRLEHFHAISPIKCP